MKVAICKLCLSLLLSVSLLTHATGIIGSSSNSHVCSRILAASSNFMGGKGSLFNELATAIIINA